MKNLKTIVVTFLIIVIGIIALYVYFGVKEVGDNETFNTLKNNRPE